MTWHPTREEFLTAVENEFLEAIELMRSKNQDYAPDSNGMGNLGECEELGLCDSEDGVLIRITDKWSRVRNLMPNRGATVSVSDESFEGTIRDLAVYCLIYRTIRKKKEEIRKAQYVSATLSTETKSDRAKREEFEALEEKERDGTGKEASR